MYEYTPTTEQVRTFWASDGKHQPAAKSYGHEESALEFDRWLAARDRVVAANAWDEGYGQGVRDNERDMEPADNPYRITEENN